MTQSFAELGVPARLVENLISRGLTAPFPIQTATLPDTLAGRDVLGRGKTGSGKTLAFAIPLVSRLIDVERLPNAPVGLILCPTRELALQIAETVEPLAAAVGLNVTCIFGGVPQRRQENALRAGVDIVIACPGRLEDLMKQRLISLSDVEITILDEADHMADMGFLPGVKRILDKTPADGQRLLFSATLDNGVDVVVKRYLSNPVTHAVDSAESPVAAMTHHVFEVPNKDAKSALVTRLAGGHGKRVMFTRTKHVAKRWARQLTAAGIPSVDLHGNLSQNARQRNLEAFSTGAVKVLVATDIAARGIHVDDVELVVHVDPPAEHKAYLHRSGRTARAGSGGDVITVMMTAESDDVRTLMRQAKVSARTHQVDANSPIVAELAGPEAPRVAPAPIADAAPAQSGKGGAGRNAGRGARRGAPKVSVRADGTRSRGGRNAASEVAARAERSERGGARSGASRSGRSSFPSQAGSVRGSKQASHGVSGHAGSHSGASHGGSGALRNEHRSENRNDSRGSAGGARGGSRGAARGGSRGGAQGAAQGAGQGGRGGARGGSQY